MECRFARKTITKTSRTDISHQSLLAEQSRKEISPRHAQVERPLLGLGVNPQKNKNGQSMHHRITHSQWSSLASQPTPQTNSLQRFQLIFPHQIHQRHKWNHNQKMDSVRQSPPCLTLHLKTVNRRVDNGHVSVEKTLKPEHKP